MPTSQGCCGAQTKCTEVGTYGLVGRLPDCATGMWRARTTCTGHRMGVYKTCFCCYRVLLKWALSLFLLYVGIIIIQRLTMSHWVYIELNIYKAVLLKVLQLAWELTAFTLCQTI